MEKLGLGKTQLPASKFPEPADIYVCDKCAIDVTEHLHRGRAHVWRTLGPPGFRCHCGQKYLSGAVEWDSLGNWEKRLRQIVGMLILLALPLATFVVLLRLAVSHPGIVLLALCIGADFPSILLLIAFAGFLLEGFDVIASLWRTRVGS